MGQELLAKGLVSKGTFISLNLNPLVLILDKLLKIIIQYNFYLLEV